MRHRRNRRLRPECPSSCSDTRPTPSGPPACRRQITAALRRANRRSVEEKAPYPVGAAGVGACANPPRSKRRSRRSRRSRPAWSGSSPLSTVRSPSWVRWWPTILAVTGTLRSTPANPASVSSTPTTHTWSPGRVRVPFTASQGGQAESISQRAGSAYRQPVGARNLADREPRLGEIGPVSASSPAGR